MARRMNCVHRVDQVVVRKAVTEAVAWGHDYVLSVNLDGATLTEPGFVDWLAHTLRSTGLAPRRLAVEVLETSLIEHDEPALDALARLRELGVRVVVDDFGAGYASLVRLQALQPDIVKIDRSLVAVQTDPTTATPLLSGVAQLAHQMGAIVVAEGIETPTQLTAAIAAGCDAVQGYLLGRPTTPEACRLLVAQAQDVPTQA
jgi:EAL domain-containing protein (putative c-di-GMP-specific phosphodiesterase class I)